MAYDDESVVDNVDTFEAEAVAEEGGNRTFFIAVGVLGGIALLALLCIAAYAFLVLPNQRARTNAALATTNAQNTAVVMAVTQTRAAFEAAAAQPATATATLAPTDTPTPTATSVVVVATSTPQGGASARTATLAALLTQQAQAPTVTPTQQATETALPGTGFADEVGLPMMLGIAVLLVGVIFVARKMRTA